jgi:predicted transcriptional regulator
MEVLKVLIESPMVPTRISQVCNIRYDRLPDFLDHMEKINLIKRETQEGHEVYHITDEGLSLYRDWERIWAKLNV